jgi:hypothetical protein
LSTSILILALKRTHKPMVVLEVPGAAAAAAAVAVVVAVAVVAVGPEVAAATQFRLRSVKQIK